MSILISVLASIGALVVIVAVLEFVATMLLIWKYGE
jgi:hypothetical protein